MHDPAAVRLAGVLRRLVDILDQLGAHVVVNAREPVPQARLARARVLAQIATATAREIEPWVDVVTGSHLRTTPGALALLDEGEAPETRDP